MTDQTPAPQNLDAEENVLGAILVSPKVLDEIAGDLDPGMFYRASHGTIYTACLDLYRAGQQPDALTLADALERRGELEAAGGKVRVFELAALVPATTYAAQWAQIVREHWKRREVLLALAEATRQAWDTTGDEALELLERAALDLRAQIERGHRNVVSGIEAAEWFDEKMRNPPDEEEGGVPGPLRVLRWWRRGRLYVLGGYAADGKTALAMQSMRSAVEGKRRVGFVTLEMSWQDLVDRLVTTYGVPYRQAQSGKVMEGVRSAAIAAVSALATANVDLIDDESADAAAIWRYQRLGRYDFLIIDHLHAMDWEERRELEREVRAIRVIARRENIPVLMLAQLNRGKDRSRPTISSFRESGVIEQEAALAACIWRVPDANGLPTDDAELIVVKNRFGRVGSYPLRLVGNEVRFVERKDADNQQTAMEVS